MFPGYSYSPACPLRGHQQEWSLCVVEGSEQGREVEKVNLEQS